MARPRVHAPEVLLDAAEELLVEQGRTGLTVRTLALRAGASNGSIYHAFGSLENVVAGAWLRRARQFLDLQRTAVEAELAEGNAPRAVQAAADCPARLAEQDPGAARLLTALSREDVLAEGVPDTVAVELRALDRELTGTLQLLAEAAWGRADAEAVAVVHTCVVRLPAALLFPEIRAGVVRPLTRRQLAGAVGAVLDCGVPG
jgi:AcrR family transcriptional regulator